MQTSEISDYQVSRLDARRDCGNYRYFANNSRLGRRLSGDNRLPLEIILQAKESRMKLLNQRVANDSSLSQTVAVICFLSRFSDLFDCSCLQSLGSCVCDNVASCAVCRKPVICSLGPSVCSCIFRQFSY